MLGFFVRLGPQPASLWACARCQSPNPPRSAARPGSTNRRPFISRRIAAAGAGGRVGRFDHHGRNAPSHSKCGQLRRGRKRSTRRTSRHRAAHSARRAGLFSNQAAITSSPPCAEGRREWQPVRKGEIQRGTWRLRQPTPRYRRVRNHSERPDDGG